MRFFVACAQLTLRATS